MIKSATLQAEASSSVNWYDALVIFPLFVLTSTHFGFAGLISSAGPSTLLKAIAAIAFFAAVELKYPWQGLSSRLPLILGVCIYFLLLNLFDLTPFALMSLVFISVGLATGSCLARFRPVMLDVLLRTYVAFNVLGLALALALLLGTGEIVDVHQLVFPFSTSRVEEYLGHIRVAGFQVEPGTYTNVIYIFVLMRSILRGRLYSRLDLVAMLSTLATLAAWAPIGVGAYLVALCLESVLVARGAHMRKRRLQIGLLLLLAVAMAPFMGAIAESEFVTYFSKRYQGGESSGSTQLKIDAFNAWLAHVDVRMLLGTALPDTYCADCDSLQDLGVLPNMAFYLGLIPTAALLVVLWVRLWRTSVAILVFSLPVAVTKFYFYEPVVWVLIGIILGTAYGDQRADQTKVIEGAGDRPQPPTQP